MNRIYPIVLGIAMIGSAFSSSYAASTNHSCINLTSNLRYKSTGSEVATLQGFLKANKYLDSNPTGFFGPLTVSAVKKFQLTNTIESTGYVGPITRAKIAALSCTNNLLTSNTAPSSTGISACAPGDLFNILTGAKCAVVPSDNYVLSYTYNRNMETGSKGVDVVALQSFLEAKGFLIIAQGVAKGNFDEATKNALASYQSSVGITPADGTFGPITRATLNGQSSPAITPTNTSSSIGGDIVVSDFSWTPTIPSINQTDKYVYFNFTIKNIGTNPITIPTNTEFIFYKDSVISSNQFGGLSIGTGVFTLAPGESKTFLNTATQHNANILLSAGTFSIILVADSNNLVSESIDTNNSMQKSITISSVAARTGVTLDDFTWSPATPKVSVASGSTGAEYPRLNVTLSNIGSNGFSSYDTSQNFSLYIGDVRPENKLSLSSGPTTFNLNSGETKGITFIMSGGQLSKMAGTFPITLILDENNQTPSVNRSYNTIQKSITLVEAAQPHIDSVTREAVVSDLGKSIMTISGVNFNPDLYVALSKNGQIVRATFTSGNHTFISNSSTEFRLYDDTLTYGLHGNYQLTVQGYYGKSNSIDLNLP